MGPATPMRRCVCVELIERNPVLVRVTFKSCDRYSHWVAESLWRQAVFIGKYLSPGCIPNDFQTTANILKPFFPILSLWSPGGK